MADYNRSSLNIEYDKHFRFSDEEKEMYISSYSALIYSVSTIMIGNSADIKDAKCKELLMILKKKIRTFRDLTSLYSDVMQGEMQNMFRVCITPDKYGIAVILTHYFNSLDDESDNKKEIIEAIKSDADIMKAAEELQHKHILIESEQIEAATILTKLNVDNLEKLVGIIIIDLLNESEDIFDNVTRIPVRNTDKSILNWGNTNVLRDIEYKINNIIDSCLKEVNRTYGKVYIYTEAQIDGATQTFKDAGYRDVITFMFSTAHTGIKMIPFNDVCFGKLGDNDRLNYKTLTNVSSGKAFIQKLCPMINGSNGYNNVEEEINAFDKIKKVYDTIDNKKITSLNRMEDEFRFGSDIERFFIYRTFLIVLIAMTCGKKIDTSFRWNDIKECGACLVKILWQWHILGAISLYKEETHRGLFGIAPSIESLIEASKKDFAGTILPGQLGECVRRSRSTLFVGSDILSEAIDIKGISRKYKVTSMDNASEALRNNETDVLGRDERWNAVKKFSPTFQNTQGIRALEECSAIVEVARILNEYKLTEIDIDNMCDFSYTGRLVGDKADGFIVPVILDRATDGNIMTTLLDEIDHEIESGTPVNYFNLLTDKIKSSSKKVRKLLINKINEAENARLREENERMRREREAALAEKQAQLEKERKQQEEIERLKKEKEEQEKLLEQQRIERELEEKRRKDEEEEAEIRRMIAEDEAAEAERKRITQAEYEANLIRRELEKKEARERLYNENCEIYEAIEKNKKYFKNPVASVPEIDETTGEEKMYNLYTLCELFPRRADGKLELDAIRIRKQIEDLDWHEESIMKFIEDKIIDVLVKHKEDVVDPYDKEKTTYKGLAKKYCVDTKKLKERQAESDRFRMSYRHAMGYMTEMDGSKLDVVARAFNADHIRSNYDGTYLVYNNNGMFNIPAAVVAGMFNKINAKRLAEKQLRRADRAAKKADEAQKNADNNT